MRRRRSIIQRFSSSTSRPEAEERVHHVGGHAKILDFGLAKLVEPQPALAGGIMLATAAPATTPGVVLGTVSYMAPQQVRGPSADHRADRVERPASLHASSVYRCRGVRAGTCDSGQGA